MNEENGKTPPTRERIRITDEMRDMLFGCRARTGIGSRNLLRITPGPHPEGLSTDLIESWLTGRTKTVRTDLWHYVLGAWKNAPAASSVGRNLGPGRITVTDAMKAELRYLKDATGVGPHRLMRLGPEPKPQGLRTHTIQTWLNGLASTARSDHWQYVLDAWASMPRRLVITDEMRVQLQALRTNSGLGATRLLRLAPNPIPSGLKPSTVNGWLSGAAKTVRTDHWQYILDVWQSLPQSIAAGAIPADTPPVPVPPPPPRPQRVPMTDDKRRKLREQRERTGLGPSAFITAVGDRPKGLGQASIAGWLSGTAKTARADHLAFVLRKWAELPTRIAITQGMREALKAERDRTGVAPRDLLKGDADAPEKLSSHVIENWLSGIAATALEDHLDYVLRKWRALPTRSE